MGNTFKTTGLIVLIPLLSFTLKASANNNDNEKNPPTTGGQASSCEGFLSPDPASFDEKNRDPFRLDVENALRRALRDYGIEGTDSLDIQSMFTEPPRFALGQLAFPCFQLAKILRAPPPKIARDLADKIARSPLEMVERVDVEGGYINFTIRFDHYLEWLGRRLDNKQLFNARPENFQKENVIVEFSQPNTHKALHIGHMRNMFLGESVARLLEYFGHNVARVTYPGDLGTHVAKVIWYVQRFKSDKLATGDAHWLGQMYAEADKFITEHEMDPSIREQIANTLRCIENGVGSDAEVYSQTRDWSLTEMADVYGWLGIHFDRWYYESACDLPSRELVLKKLQEGVLQRNDGAVGMDLSDIGLGFVLMLKKDGSGLYMTKDLELLRRKFSDFDATRSIVIVDARQKLHFQQVFASAERMGIAKSTQSTHLAYETVTDKDGKAFSSRALNGGLSLNEVRSHIEERFSKSGAIDREFGRSIAQLAVDSLRFGFLKTAPSAQIRFDPDHWLNKHGDSILNLMTNYRKMKTIAESGGEARIRTSQDPSQELTIAEKQVIAHLGQFNLAVAKSARNLDPSELTRYLIVLDQLLDSIDANRWQGLESRTLAHLCAETLRTGMSLLGIDGL